MWFRLLSRALAAVLPQNETILPLWRPQTGPFAPLRELIIVDGEILYRRILLYPLADI